VADWPKILSIGATIKRKNNKIKARRTILINYSLEKKYFECKRD